MMAKLCSNFDGNICSSETIVDKNQTYEPLLPENLVISKSNYDILQNVQNTNNTYKNTTRGRIEQRNCTKEHNQTFERLTSLDNNQAKVEHDDYYTEIQTQMSCNSDVYESIDAKELNPPHCASTHLTRSCNKRFTFKGRRKNCLACFIFWVLLAVVITGVTVSLLLKNNSLDPDKQNTQAQDHWWIGLTDTKIEGSFEWISGHPLSYTDWYQGIPRQPDNVDHGGRTTYVNCASLSPFFSFQWMDDNCVLSNGCEALCEFREQ